MHKIAKSHYALLYISIIIIPGFCVLKGTIETQVNKYLNGSIREKVSFNSFQTQDQKSLIRHAILYKNPSATATILICHGFMCNKTDVSFLRTLMFRDYNVLIFDFRAHGEAIEPEHCCTFGRDEAFDVLGAVSYLRSREELKSLPLIAYGFSMGAVAIIQAAAHATMINKTEPGIIAPLLLEGKIFDAMILDCAYDSSVNVIKDALERLKISVFGYSFDMPGKHLLQKYVFNPYVQSLVKTVLKTIAHMDATATNTYIHPVSPVESIKVVDVPCFFIHCYNDEKVKVDAARNIYANAAGYKRLWITPGRHHFDSFFFNHEKYVFKVNKFISQVLAGDLIQKKVQEKVIFDS